MIVGKTEKGFEFEVNENIGNDFRIVMAVRKLKSDDKIAKVEGTYDYVEAILGKSGIDKMIKFATKQVGYPDSDFIIAQAEEILAIANEGNPEIKK